jgi:hypothetical protein
MNIRTDLLSRLNGFRKKEKFIESSPTERERRHMNEAKISQMMHHLEERLGYINKKIRMDHEVKKLALDIGANY